MFNVHSVQQKLGVKYFLHPMPELVWA